MDSDPNSAVPGASANAPFILDTNIVLDVFVFNDEDAQPLRDRLGKDAMTWIATQAMRVELERVLTYPQIVPRLAFYQLTAAEVLAKFDQHTRIVPVAPKALISCTDRDDQCFIDLAIQHKARLISKDRAVLKMKNRLAAYGARAGKTWLAVTK